VFLTNFVEKRSKIYFVSRFVAEKVGCSLKCVFHSDNNMIRFLPLCKTASSFAFSIFQRNLNHLHLILSPNVHQEIKNMANWLPHLSK
jgi:hypothetical protein